VDNVIGIILKQLASGGPVAGWLVAVYALARLHQLTDRQHAANLKTIKALTAIKTVLFAKGGIICEDEE
jgi:hypothetical protein